MDILSQWLEASGVTEPTLEDILKASDEMEEFFDDESEEG